MTNLTNHTTEDKNQARDDHSSCDKKKTRDDVTPLPLFADVAPPEPGALVVVHATAIDADGNIWGVLDGWRGCRGYLPPGASARLRRERNDFATAVRRGVRRRGGAPHAFVAEVVRVDDESATGVETHDIEATRHFVTLDRRTLAPADAPRAFARMLRAKRAARTVDDAVIAAGVAREAARRATLWPCYARALTNKNACDNDDDADDVEPEAAGARLVEALGRVGAGDVTAATALLCAHAGADAFATLADTHFASALLAAARDARARLSKPRRVVRLIELRAGDVRALRAAAAAAEAVRRTEAAGGGAEAQGVRVRIAGPPKYELETHACEDERSAAEALLDAAETAARAALAAAASAPDAAAAAPCPPSEGLDRAVCGVAAQPTLNVGVIGDVAHGKSTLTKALTGKTTQQHSKETRAHGATIKLGFANCALWRCADGACTAPGCFRATAGDARTPDACAQCGGPMALARRVSLVDCPGHSELMATMLTGAASFDAALLVAAASAPCPAPQAAAHVAALDAVGAGPRLRGRVAVVQSKSELALATAGGGTGGADVLGAHAAACARFGARTAVVAGAPVLPVCAPLGAGVDAVACFLATVGAARADDGAPARFRVLRSFDVSRTGGDAARDEMLRGGVIGGSLERGALAVSAPLELRPGAWRAERRDGGPPKKGGTAPVVWRCAPLRTVVEGIKSDDVELARAARGGLVALRTRLDPAATRDDALVGAVAGAPGTLPAVWGPSLLLTEVALVEELAGIAERDASSDDEDDEGDTRRGFKPKRGEVVRVHAGADCVEATVARASRSAAKLELELARPLCADAGDVVVIATRARRGGGGWRLSAHARLADGARCAVDGEDDARVPDGVHCAVDGEHGAHCAVDRVDEARAPGDGGGDSGATGSEREPAARAAEAAAAAARDALCDATYLRDRFESALEASGWGAADAPRVKLPALVLGRDGGAHAVWANFAAVCAALARPADHVAAFLVAEGGMRVARMGEHAATAAAGGGASRDGRNALRVAHRGRGLRERLGALLRRYARVYVACAQCYSAHTQLTRGGATLRGAKAMVECKKCAATRFVPALGKAAC